MRPSTSACGKGPAVPTPTGHDGHDDRRLDASQILVLFTALGRMLQAQGLVVNIHVVGGAAIALTLKDDRVTQDVDAIVTDHSAPFHAAARQVAREYGVSERWIEDDVSEFVSRTPLGAETEITLPGLRVFVASPEHLLAMKTRAATTRMTPRDSDDLVFLADHLGLDSPEQIATLTARQFEGVYRDTLGYDEYLETARFALTTAALERGEDPAPYYPSDDQPSR